ncbi:sigma-70 family RNA polymerase sigma factor [Actinoplanes solisilvae]|uniref:sigma-70 family RNA polymerase sigma factor n=1 Tax=Actinoplanes solisilvae TaxID=2486853 RepID=UPI000FDCC592|nr:sigma-70 family RNA polymerase sigma factor [Actinoplanes solisilvae]
MHAKADTTLVIAAREGDREALNELVAAHLPLVYNLVRQALSGGPDVDDVVQDVMLQAVRRLRRLRSPESFRPWLIALAVRQIEARDTRDTRADDRPARLDEVAAAGVEDAALLRVELGDQRRQVLHAARWLNPGDRAVLSLWWLEVAGELDRADVAAALHITVAHAGVRLQRMGEQLEAARAVVAALDARPGCPELDSLAATWDGVPGPFWRKRFARHARGCPACSAARTGWIPADRLLLGLALVPVPAALVTKNLTVAPAGVLAGLAQTAALHPIASGVTAAVVAAGLTVPAVGWVTAPQPATAVDAASQSGSGATAQGALPPPAGRSAIAAGPVSLESANSPGRFLSLGTEPGSLRALTAADPLPERKAATLRAGPGLADSACYSFRATDGRYLRHSSFRLRLSPDEGTVLFRRDSTFCARAGSAAGSVSFESYNFPGYFLRHLDEELWLDQFDGGAGFLPDASLLVRPPLG